MDPAPLPVDLWVSECKSHYAFDSQTRTMTVIDYKGYRIEVCSVGRGWRAVYLFARFDHSMAK